jgi:hypothetical protein
MLSEPLDVTIMAIEALDKLDIPYLIGGSLASALYGTARSTLDVDLVADLQLEHVQPLVDILGKTFYIDSDMIRDAILHHSTFNIIHLETMFKIDIFVLKTRPFDQVQFKRRRIQTISSDPERKAYVTTAEDILLVKLEWFRMGGEVSDRQWKDILGVIKVQSDRLDSAYLSKWAEELGIVDLLQKALHEAG